MKMKNFAHTPPVKDNWITQEVSFAKVLAGNDKKLRDRAVKKLMKWLSVRSQCKTTFTEDNFQRIWSGLFYCMWMSDKFLIQEELAESISKLIHCFSNSNELGLMFIKCFYKIMALEWSGIDQHRIDKFNMLIRRFLRQSLEYCNRKEWDVSLVKSLAAVFEETVINADVPNGYLLHFTDIFLEELSKVTKGKVDSEIILIFLEPFVKITATTKDPRIHKAVSLLFDFLIKQTDIGIEYQEKLRAWKELQMPCERPEELELSIENSQEGEEENGDSELDEMLEDTALDPRAGRVDAILHQIPTDCNGILQLIKKYQNIDSVTNAGIRELRNLEIKFSKLRRGKMPENVRKPKILQQAKKKRRHTSKCVKNLMEYTKQLDEDMDLDLMCDEIDSDEEPNDEKSESSEEDISESENSPSSVEKKVKSEKKMKKKASSPVPAAEENMGDVKEMKKTKVKNRDGGGNKNDTQVEEKEKKKKKKINSNGVTTNATTTTTQQEQKKKKKINSNGVTTNATTTMTQQEQKKKKKKKNMISKDGNNSEILKPKSPKDAFVIEEVNEGSDALMTPKTKRKLSNSWIVDEIKNEEDNKIVTPKIIKLETRTSSNSEEQVKERVTSEDCDTPVGSGTPQLRLSAAFWENAKKKVMKNKKISLPNPHYFDQQKNPRRISFALERNEAQENDEYLNEVRNSPSIPFDGTRKPMHSALKSGLAPSPINPFYRFKTLH